MENFRQAAAGLNVTVPSKLVEADTRFKPSKNTRAPNPDSEMPSQHFRVAFLRCLSLPLPLAPQRCRRGCYLDPLGDHRAACPTTGHLAARAFMLEHAVARVCRESGAEVARNIALTTMNVEAPLQTVGVWN